MAASMGQQLCVGLNIASRLKILKARHPCKFHDAGCIFRHRKIYRTVRIAGFSSFNNPGSRNDVDEANEDFFGIPADFKLQHARLDATSNSADIETNCKSNSAYHKDDVIDRSDTYVRQEYEDSINTGATYQQKEPQSRHNRRKKAANNAHFPTSFGLISFDKAVSMKNQENLETLCAKAKKILNTSARSNSAPGTILDTGSMAQNQAKHFKEKIETKLDNINSFNINYSKSQSHRYSEDKIHSSRSTISADSDQNNFMTHKGNKEWKEQDEQMNTNLFDEQYFDSVLYEKEISSSPPLKTNEIEEQYFGAEILLHTNPAEKSTCGKYEGKVEANSQSDFHSNHDKDDNVFEKQYFSNPLVRDKDIKGFSSEKIHNKSHRPNPLPLGDVQSYQVEGGLNEVDQQYFGQSESSLQSESQMISGLEATVEQYSNINATIADSLQLSKMGENETKVYTMSQHASKTPVQHTHKFGANSNQKLNLSHITAAKTNISVKNDIDAVSVAGSAGFCNKKTEQNDVITNENYLATQKKLRKAYTSKLSGEKEESDSAFAFAMNVRHNLNTAQKMEETSSFKIPKVYDTKVDDLEGVELMGKRCRFDSKGYRILDLQVPNFDKMTSADVIHMLKSRIIFNHDDFLVIDKPYGLPSFGQQYDRLSMSGLLPALVSSLPRNFQADQLHIVQGLDRDVTGALVLAKTPEVAQEIKRMYNSSESCIQRFWAITKGVPKPPEGTVNIPIGEGRVAGLHKRMLRPLYRPSIHPGVKLSKAPSEAAVTEYKVLDRTNSVALLECTPHTNGVKHQLRVHLAYGINTPILGDHKYSHFSRLAPQKLDPSSLALLKIRQAKVRHLALHLHLRTVVLTNYRGRMIFLTTRPPAHFIDNLRSLKLHLPKK
ncbi:RNA pseudouridylate synthase domain-containing protein 4 [Plakobranchus ocellatus]|uniref:Pseudouridylate synthase RPUSD4, mitochondrial n=1 Tax=Plakobranchus ocellatus TaxID=259542 RepID=A0AAV4BPZ6_9GAST|nr:RNA pseudouridylate synthase domain-containing protein 4 [Plakobranchus ocellatus]